MREHAQSSGAAQSGHDRPSAGQVVHALEVLAGDRVDDTALVALVRAGEPRGAALLYDRFAPLVRGLVGRAFGPSEDASDLVQEVLIAVVESIGELRDPASLRSFVYGVALNKVRMEARRRSRRFMFFGRRPRVEPIGDAAADEATAAAQRLYELLDELGEQTRVLFVLRYVEELPLAEIALLTHTSLATTKRRLAKATRVVWAKARAIPELAGYVPGHASEPASVSDASIPELPFAKEPRHA